MIDRELSIESISGWISVKLRKEFGIEIASAWIFGSALQKLSKPNDIDLLIIIDEEEVEHLAMISSMIRKEFSEYFGLPVHLTRFTKYEHENNRALIEKLLNKGSKKII